MLYNKLEGHITRAATSIKGRFAQQKLGSISVLEVIFLCVIVCVFVFIPVGYHVMKQDPNFMEEGSLPHLRGHLSGALGKVADTWDKQPLVARRMVASEEIETMTGEDYVELSTPAALKSVDEVEADTKITLAGSASNHNRANKNVKATKEPRDSLATDLSRKRGKGKDNNSANLQAAASARPELTAEQREEALVKEVLQDNPPEDKGEREEWANKQGVHRKENIF